MINESLLYRIWLSLACTPGSETFACLSDAFGEENVAEEAYRADEKKLSPLFGRRTRDLVALTDKSLDHAERIMNYCDATGIRIVPYDAPDYPTPFLEMRDRPVLIYVRGELPDFRAKLSVSIVGTRSMTSYGKKAAFRIAFGLAAADVLVVSGMARGIDAVAAVGALYGGGKTVAVLGSGLDVIYPPEHASLSRVIAEAGAVISEYPPGARPERHHFPCRNRLISALSEGVFVVEGDLGSGAMITATAAEKQGKRLFALPGDADRVTSEGPNLLIQQGAVAVTGADDILNAFAEETVSEGMFSLLQQFRFGMIDRILRSYGVSPATVTPERTEGDNGRADARPAYTHATMGRPTAKRRKEPSAAPDVLQVAAPAFFGSEAAARIHKVLSDKGEMTANDLKNALNDMPFHEIAACLTELEMMGTVEQRPGGRYGVCK